MKSKEELVYELLELRCFKPLGPPNSTLTLDGTNYQLDVNYKGCLMWFKILRITPTQLDWEEVNFQHVLENSPPEIAIKLLFHLDLFT